MARTTRATAKTKTIKIDTEIYEAVSIIVEPSGKTVETMVEEFLDGYLRENLSALVAETKRLRTALATQKNHNEPHEEEKHEVTNGHINS